MFNKFNLRAEVLKQPQNKLSFVLDISSFGVGVKITIPHIHKIEGEAGFWAKVAQTGKIEELKIETLTGLRQIEGILIGRKVQELSVVVSRICGICPVVHILNASCAIEKALEIKVSPLTILLRKLFLASQIIQSHTLHLFFMSLADFFDIENDLDLMKKFPKEADAAIKIRDFSLKITKIIGGRAVHPITSQIGGFVKMPKKEELQKTLEEYQEILDAASLLIKTFQNLSYPELKRETKFVSLYSEKEYPFYQENYVKIGDEKLTPADFYSNKIEENLKTPPLKRVEYKGEPYMPGPIARIKNNRELLSSSAKAAFDEFLKVKSLSEKDFFENRFYNLFSQAIEILYFLEKSQEWTKEILESDLNETIPKIKITKGSGLSAMEAPRGTLFTYFEIDKDGRIINCNIITPTAQFLTNMEEDLKVYLPDILKLKDEERKRKIRSLIRVYDPCISCAVH